MPEFGPGQSDDALRKKGYSDAEIRQLRRAAGSASSTATHGLSEDEAAKARRGGVVKQRADGSFYVE
jgi:hypothetical protein